MSTWSLADIREKTRRVTGRLTSGDMSNIELDERINKYYTLTFPAELKLERKLTYYEFLTVENTAWYDLPNTTFTNLEPPATIDNFNLLWYQDSPAFFDNNPDQIVRRSEWTGDGIETSFTTTITQFPILPDSLIITDDVEIYQDTSKAWTISNVTLNGTVISTGALTGSTAVINYSTGVISVTFTTAPLTGANIWLSFVQFKAGRPSAVLMYDNQFRFFPVPDTAYRFRVKAYSIVSALVNATDRPDLDQWGPCIAYGTARDILADYGEMDAYAEVTALYKEQLAYVLNRTIQNLLNTRAAPNF